MKRLLSLLVVIAMMVAMIPNVFAAKEDVDFDELTGRLVVLEDISAIEVALAEGSDGMIYQWTPAEDEEATELNLSWYPETAVFNVTATTGENTVTATTTEKFGELTLPIVAGQLVEIEVSEANGAAVESAYIYGSLSGYPAGHETNPIDIEYSGFQATIEKAAWFGVRYGGTVVIEGEGAFNVIYEGETIAAVDGKVEIQGATAQFGPVPVSMFQIDAAGTYTFTMVIPVGSMENPAQLVMGENTAEIEANAQGYFYIWTATEEGTLKITMPEGNWSYQIHNLTTYQYGDTQWSDSDPVVNPAEIAVAAGDEIQIVINTYDPSAWATPAGTITFTAEFVLPEPPAPALTITKQPENILAFNNDPVTLSVEAEGEGLKYLWYRQEPGATTWTAFNVAANASAGTANFAFTAYTGNHGRQYKCVITDAAGNTVETEPVSLAVRFIKKQPVSQYISNYGQAATFNVEYSVTDGVTYQWQLKYSTEADSRWRNTSASGNKTNALTFSTTNTANRYMFRCVINDNGTQVITNVVQLWLRADRATIKSATTGTLNLVEGYYAFLSVEAEGVGMEYYWQATTDGGETWYNCSSSTTARTANFRVLAYPYRQGYQYRCMILTPDGADYKQVFTEPVTFNILPAADITEQPANVEAKLGEKASFSVKVQPTDGLIMDGSLQLGDGTTFTYKWQRSKTGNNWVYINSYEGAQSDTLLVPVTEAQDGYYYRCVVFNDSGYGMGYVFSEPAQLTVVD